MVHIIQHQYSGDWGGAVQFVATLGVRAWQRLVVRLSRGPFGRRKVWILAGMKMDVLDVGISTCSRQGGYS